MTLPQYQVPHDGIVDEPPKDKPLQVVSADGSPADSREQQINDFLLAVQTGALRAAVLATRCQAEAMDLVQDAMLRWVKSRYDERPADEWRPLFFRVLQNRIRDWQRRSILTGRIFSKPTDDEGEGLDISAIASLEVNHSPLPEQQLGHHQFSQALIVALRSLPRRQREVFVLRTWQGLSTKETAVAMGCGEGSVMTHLSRAHHRLRDLLKEFDLHDEK
jgi:RNA polymerase sigma-70 factor (ECF subfamily)